MQLENNLSSVTLYRLDESPIAICAFPLRLLASKSLALYSKNRGYKLSDTLASIGSYRPYHNLTTKRILDRPNSWQVFNTLYVLCLHEMRVWSMVGLQILYNPVPLE